jgi:hypothetical protein
MMAVSLSMDFANGDAKLTDDFVLEEATVSRCQVKGQDNKLNTNQIKEKNLKKRNSMSSNRKLRARFVHDIIGRTQKE